MTDHKRLLPQLRRADLKIVEAGHGSNFLTVIVGRMKVNKALRLKLYPHDSWPTETPKSSLVHITATTQNIYQPYSLSPVACRRCHLNVSSHPSGYFSARVSLFLRIWFLIGVNLFSFYFLYLLFLSI